MKKLFVFLIAFLLSASFLQAQKTYVLTADSVSNSQTKTGNNYYINLEKFAPYDSISLSIYASGEIDLDSLDVQGGVFVANYDYKGSTQSNFSVYEALTGATLTINNADGVATYVQNVLTITKAAATGYNRLKVSVVSAAAGNDKTDTGQKFIVFYTVF